MKPTLQVICGYGEDPEYGPYWIVRNSWVRQQFLSWQLTNFSNPHRALFGVSEDTSEFREDETLAESRLHTRCTLKCKLDHPPQQDFSAWVC